MHRLVPKLTVTCALLTALTGGICCAPSAQAQPPANANLGGEIIVTQGENGPVVNVSAESVSAAMLVETIAEKAELNFAIYDDAVIPFVEVVNLSPADALKKIVAAANLSLYLDNGTYVVWKKPDAGQENPVDLNFHDISVKELLRTLQEEFGLEIEVSPSVNEKIIAIKCVNATPSEIVEKIARGARLSLTVTADGVYRIGFENKKTPEN